MPLKTSTPGLQWQTKGGSRYAYWVPTKKGCGVSAQLLWSGIEPTQDDLDRISGACMRLYAELRAKINEQQGVPKPGKVYFVQCGALVKIGYTTNFPQRLESIRTACPDEVAVLHVMPGTRQAELGRHLQFAHLRRAGEWFVLNDEIRQCIALEQASDHAP